MLALCAETDFFCCARLAGCWKRPRACCCLPCRAGELPGGMLRRHAAGAQPTRGLPSPSLMGWGLGASLLPGCAPLATACRYYRELIELPLVVLLAGTGARLLWGALGMCAARRSQPSLASDLPPLPACLPRSAVAAGQPHAGCAALCGLPGGARPGGRRRGRGRAQRQRRRCQQQQQQQQRRVRLWGNARRLGKQSGVGETPYAAAGLEQLLASGF